MGARMSLANRLLSALSTGSERGSKHPSPAVGGDSLGPWVLQTPRLEAHAALSCGEVVRELAARELGPEYAEHGQI